MTRHRRSFVAGILIALLLAGVSPSSSAFAQRRNRAAVTVAIPSPKSVLGYEPGDDRTIADWRQITDYFARLDKASDRVTVQTIGETTLKRPIIVAVISARENLLALNKYKEIQQKLADPRLIATPQETAQLLHDGKVVLTISCSIHSTEIVASQMSMRLAY